MINAMHKHFKGHKNDRNCEKGFTLVELMISVALGLLLISGLVTAFVGSQRTSKLNTTLTEMQETGRFALDSMIRDLRMAGFQGCANITHTPANIRAESAPTDNLMASSFQAFEVVSRNVWTPQPHDSFKKQAVVGRPVPGTQAFSVQFGSPTTYRIEEMVDTLSPVVVANDVSELVTGDLAIVSNCSSADLFEISANSGSTLQHSGSVNGGDDRLSAPYGQGSEQNRARIMRFHANIYYIGDTKRTDGNGKPVRALFRQTLPYTNAPIEMAEGVENLRIRLGIEDPINPGDLSFVTPGHALLATHLVKSVQLGFLISSYESVSEELDTRTYKIAGYDIPAASGDVTHGETHSSDKKMRLPFNGTVSIRNQ